MNQGIITIDKPIKCQDDKEYDKLYCNDWRETFTGSGPIMAAYTVIEGNEVCVAEIPVSAIKGMVLTLGIDGMTQIYDFTALPT